MLRLLTFGGLSVSDGSDSLGGAAGQHRALALLALLASAGTRGISRDRLIAYLWSESEADRARHSLRQWLTLLRRDLRDSEVILGHAELRLNASQITSDVAEFDEALARHAFERAAELYTGSFLEGFYLNGAPEFQRWVEEERSRRRTQVLEAVEALATSDDQEEERSKSVQWWQRLATLDPLNSRIAVRYMESLSRVGDRTRALDYARVHEALVRAELSTEADPAVRDLAQRLRVPAASRERENAATDTELQRAATGAPARTTPLSLSIPQPEREATAAGHTLSSRVRHVVRAIAAGVTIAALALVALTMRDASPTAMPADSNAVIVAPFRVSGADSTLGYLREGMIDLLAAKLPGNGGPRAIDPRSVVSVWHRTVGDRADVPLSSALAVARQLGAGTLILGAVVGRQSSVVLTASLLRVPDGRVRARASVEGSPDSIPVLVDRLTSQLLAESSGDVALLASVTTTTLPALRLYLDGQAAYRRGHYLAAYDDFRSALKLDSSFALAALGVLRAGQWTWSNIAEYRETERRAWEARDRLNPRDRALLLLRLGPRYPAPMTDADRLAAAEAAVVAAPDDAESWYQFGDVLFHFGAALGIEDARARAMAAFRRTLQIDSAYVPPLDHVIELAVVAGDSSRARHLFDAAHDSLGDLKDYVRWRTAFVTDSTTLRAVRRRIPSMSEASLERIAGLGQLDGIEIGDVEAAVDALQARGGTRAGPEELMYLRHTLELNRGRPNAALAALEPPRRVFLWTGPAMLLLLDALFWDGDTAAAGRAVRELDRAASTHANGSSNRSAYRYTAICGSGLWRLLRSGDEGFAERAIQQLRAATASASTRHVSDAGTMCADALEAVIAVNDQRADANQPLERLDSLARTGIDGFIFGSPEGYVFGSAEANLLIARLRERRGDLAGARRALRRRVYHYGVGLFARGYSSTSFREEGRLAALLGDRGDAIKAYRNYLGLRDAPEPSRTAEVAFVRAEVARLQREVAAGHNEQIARKP
jgi:DNA-binding SARP family transcriptional activator/tetratricopeptide (TPR) repeat protein